jgi:hypothetical protein
VHILLDFLKPSPKEDERTQRKSLCAALSWFFCSANKNLRFFAFFALKCKIPSSTAHDGVFQMRGMQMTCIVVRNMLLNYYNMIFLFMAAVYIHNTQTKSTYICASDFSSLGIYFLLEEATEAYFFYKMM